MQLPYWIRQLTKYPYQRIRYGYDERIKWGFDSYFLNAMKPLKEFCQEELDDYELMEMNPRRKKILTETLRLIKNYEKSQTDAKYGDDKCEIELLVYVAKNIMIYWN